MRRKSYTFGFFSWRPRYRTYSWTPQPVRWQWFRLYDFAPLLIGMIASYFFNVNGGLMNVVAAVLAAWYFGVFPVVVWWRLRARRRYCATQGHTAYRPLSYVDQWECLYCGTPLNMADPQMVATSVAHEASQADLRQRSQAFYSDRR
jgi:hypothetical protein